MSLLDREYATTSARFEFGASRGGAKAAMTEVWLRAALWLGLALAATLISIRLRIATALSEIVVGTVAQLLIGAFVGTALLGTTESWVTFLSATGAVFLTFLAGAELDPAVLRTKWRETGVIGLVSFTAPFLGCAAYAHYWRASPRCFRAIWPTNSVTARRLS
jgi:Kef-type K+ transport system membrane component KefB